MTPSGTSAVPGPPRGPTPIRVLVADDHPGVLAGLVAALAAAEDVEVVATATDGPGALERARALRPDVVLTDVRMPGATGIDITPALRASGARVLVVSAFDLDAYVLGALAAGAEGYLVKSEDPRRFVEAVRQVAEGDAVLSQAATRAVVSALHRRGGSPTPPGARDQADPGRPRGAGPEHAAGRLGPAGPRRTADGGPEAGRGPATPELTRREQEVLRLLAQGLSNQQIARALVVETTTVKSHVTHVLAKLQVGSRLQAALWWQRHDGS